MVSASRTIARVTRPPYSVIAGDGGRVSAAGGRLYLSGIDPSVLDRMHRAGRIAADGPVRVFEATEVVGESTRHALADAEAWLVREPLCGAGRPRGATSGSPRRSG